jgi:hypothetical protein
MNPDLAKMFGGSTNELALIKTLMSSNTTTTTAKDRYSKPPLVQSNGFSKVPKKLNFQPTEFEQLGKLGQSKNDDEVKVEKALIELNEVRNDLIIHKSEQAAVPTNGLPLPT